METSLFILIFTSLIGVLALAYAYHFRNRALSMGIESLKEALSRTVSKVREDSEEPSEEEIREGLGELKGRVRRGIIAAAALGASALGACLVVSIAGFKYWGIALAGVSLLLACAIASLALLGDIPRALEKSLD